MNFFESKKITFLISGFLLTALIVPLYVSAMGKVWEVNWGSSSVNEEVDFVVPSLASSSRVYAIANSQWVQYNKNGSWVSSTSIATNPREVEIVGTNYYFAYSTIGQLTVRKLDSALNTLVTYSYSTTTWPTLSAYDVTVDASSSVYVVGQAYNVTSGYKWIVVKFNNAGTMQWVHISDFGGSNDAEVARNAQAIGNYLYVVGTYSINGVTPASWSAKYSATSTTPITSYVNGNSGGAGGCEVTAYNSLPYVICNTGYVYSLASSTGNVSLLVSAAPTTGVGQSCLSLAGPVPAFVSSTSGIVYTSAGCQSGSWTAKTYASRFNLATNTSTGPFYLQDWVTVDSSPTVLGNAIYAEDLNYAYVGGTVAQSSGTATQNYGLWRVSMLTCTGPINFGAWTNDDPFVGPGISIKASHVNDMRTRVNTLRTNAGLATTTWTDGPTVSAGVAVKAQHFSELRTKLNEVYVACVQTVPYAYSTTSFTTGTSILGTDINYLRLNINSAL